MISVATMPVVGALSSNTARVQIEFDPPADLEQLLAEADTSATGPGSIDAVDAAPADAPKES